jgi:uncharacterized protein (TIGR02594 family)
MKKGVIFLILLVVCVSFSYAKIVEVPTINPGESEETEPLRDASNVKRFVYAGNYIIASIEDSEIEYYHQGRMSNRLTTDSDGNLESEFKSLPFGQKVLNSGIDYPFTGKEEDESGLYYFGARYYDNNLGRFSSVDPMVGQAENLPYAYVTNNPMNLVDPTGMAADELSFLSAVEPEAAQEFDKSFLNNILEWGSGLENSKKTSKIPEYYVKAESKLGLMEEVDEGETNPEIDVMFDRIGWNELNDDSAWCAAFVGSCLVESGIQVSVNPAVRARSYLDYGEVVRPEEASFGDIIIFSRGDAQGHVGFYAGESETHYLVLGGNQDNRVKFKWYPKEGVVIDPDDGPVEYRVLGIRRPLFDVHS